MSFYATTPWRNGSASDSRSEGCVFKSRRGHIESPKWVTNKFIIKKDNNGNYKP